MVLGNFPWGRVKGWKETQATAVPMPIFNCQDCGSQVCQILRPGHVAGICYYCNTLRIDKNLTEEQKTEMRERFRKNLKKPRAIPSGAIPSVRPLEREEIDETPQTEI